MRPKFLATMLIFLLVSCDDSSDYRDIKLIKLKNGDCEVYLKKVTWGVSADNCCTYISSNKNIQDTINEPYFRMLDFFYKFNEDSELIIYHADSLRRWTESESCFTLIINSGTEVNYSNYEAHGFQNILYD